MAVRAEQRYGGWDPVSRSEQESMFGRRQDTGARLDGAKETDIPTCAKDPHGTGTPLAAGCPRPDAGPLMSPRRAP